MLRGSRVSPKEIEKLLELKGWSQAELGRQLDMHESTVSLWISGKRHPHGTARKLMKQWLAESLGEEQGAARVAV